MTEPNDAKIIPELRTLAEEAGREIMKIYRKAERNVTAKKDESPLTQADLNANRVLVRGLAKLTSEMVISEEGDEQGRPPPKGSRGPEPFWLLDPLDGTRDFVARLDTFVVCIARVVDHYPVLGLIHAPVTGETWWACKGLGCFGPEGQKLYRTDQRMPPVAAGSRSMPSERMQVFYDTFGIKNVERIGSALKFCKLAEGAVDLYPRFGPTSEWDTAAGQIIAEEAGCQVIEVKTGQRLRYGKAGLLNAGGFMASRRDLDLIAPLVKAGLIKLTPRKD